MKANFGPRRSLLIGASAAVLAVAAMPAQAQVAAAGDQEEQQQAVQGTTDIIVTAQRREERLQDVPISVAVVGGDTLEDSSIKNFEDLSAYVPSLTITKTPGADAIFMRGIGSGAGSPSLDQSVVSFIDGIYAGNARQFMSPFLDIERLEVLRGPQGALVGKNTSAGAINIITRRPGRTFEGFANAEYDFTLDGGKIEGGVTVPISQDFRVRGVAKYADYGGWVYNSISDRKEPSRRELVGRLTFAYDSGPFSATLKGELADVDVDGNPFAIVAPSVGRYVDLTKETGSSFGPEYDDVETQNFALNLSYDFGGVSLTSITGYSAYQSDQREDADFIERDLAYAIFMEDYKQWSQEFRLLSAQGGTFEWALGAYYSSSELDEERVTGIVATPAASTYRQFLQDTSVWSFYGQVTLRPLEQFWIVGSARYTDETKSGDFALYSGPNTVRDFTGTLTRTINQSFSDSQFDPSISLQYRPNRNFMLYATYAGGSKSGGFQGAISNALANSFQFEPETSRSYELGAKVTLPGKGYFSLAAFDTKYENLQLSVSIQTTSTTSFAFYTGNAGEAQVRGLEGDFFYRFSPAFEVQGGFAWTPDAEYTSYPAGPCYTGRAPTNPTTGSCDLTGFRLGFTPKFRGNITPRVEFELGNDFGVNASATLLYAGDAVNDYAGDPGSVQEAHTKIDARIGIGPRDGAWELALLGRNLTDERTFSFGGTASLASNPAVGIARDARQFAIDPPRTIALQASVKF